MLSIDQDNALTFTNGIFGVGRLEQLGTGVTTIDQANSYGGGTTISAGVLAIGAAGALGTGAIILSGGELLTTTNATIANALTFSGTSTIAAAHGTTLDEDASAYSVSNGAVLNIGSPGQDGTILWHTNDVTSAPLANPIVLQAGTLKAADGNLGLLLDHAAPLTIDAGATLDVAGANIAIPVLEGAGQVTNSGAATSMTLEGANFSGTISGALSLDFSGDAALSGLEDYTGGATLDGVTTVANAGTYDLVANENISGAPASSFINDGLFEKTGGGGVSDVTSNFINSGTLNVLSGSVQFSGGFTNNGVIQGLVTQSGGVTTISAAAPSDFNGDSLSDILLQNTDGQAAIWEMNGTTPIDQQPVGANPGPSWKAIGTGDFNGDGHADILWQNTSGQAAIWEMNGTTPIDQQAVGANPGPTWQAIGTGDFNHDGDSDILLQNANGQVAIWEMNGTTPIDQQAVGNPGPTWQVIGTGDFTGDGYNDGILFQNTNGQLAIWEMNGTTPIDEQSVADNPGPDWKAIGTGDYYGNGFSDVLFQNTSGGQLAIWEFNGTTPINQALISSLPGAGWQAIKS
jgi:autotransporter-associated beta strand protein